MRNSFTAGTFLFFGAASLSVALPGPDMGLLQEQNRIKLSSEEKIQRDVLDPILGKGTAMAFVDVEMELKMEREESTRSGMGLAEKYREKLGAAAKKAATQTEFALPGIPRPKTITAGGNERPETTQAQQATQVKGIQEERFAVKPVFKRLGVTISHDDRVLKEKEQIDLVRSRIVDAMVQYQLAPDQVSFRPTPFHKEGDKIKDWKDDLKRPEVYLPLLFASLLLLFLFWLFGPLVKFFRQYVNALREKPAAEVNVDSTIEAPESQDKGPLTSEGRLDINLTKKPDEAPPPSSEEDEAMKKFEPFAYINEENIKRLVYMFILRKEEPWVIATVVSYLRPDYQRMILTSLPVDMQAKLAMEALTVRQVTRDQVVAIDADIKENVDFVVGGMERLTTMLDEADTATRNNILNYLKNEKPLVYEKVRKHLITFDDVVSFPEREMQVLVRELKTENMAKALQDAPPEVVNKFLTNMSPGAASLLRESMEYLQGMTPGQIEEERAQIVDLIKVMEKEGKIVVRVKAQEGVDLIEGMQEELGAQERRQQRFAAARRKADPAAAAAPSPSPAPVPAQPAADPAQAQSYFDAAVGYYDAGQAEQSIQYFQYALSLNSALWQAHQYLGGALYSLGRTSEALAHYEQLLALNPDPELRAWVESFKTQVG
jgi:tetratricopeptide (TPR) repeat protein